MRENIRKGIGKGKVQYTNSILHNEVIMFHKLAIFYRLFIIVKYILT